MFSTGQFSVCNILIITFVLLLVPAQGMSGIDSPHNETNSYGCDSCHDVSSSHDKLLPPWTPPSPQTIDDTQENHLCWTCHNDDIALHVETHSSLQTSTRYGNWTVECWVCHTPHRQAQLWAYGAASYVYTGTSDNPGGVTESTLVETGAGWEVDQFKGMLLVPNTANFKYNYTVISNTSEELTVNGPIDLTGVSAGDAFAITYGKLLRNMVDLEAITDPLNDKTDSSTFSDDLVDVRFFWKTGQNSYADDDADGDGIRDGICEVCHTETTHFRNDGSGDDQTHNNVGGAAGKDCIQCHDHSNGFAHGGGSGAGCIECHGHDSGTVYGETPNSLLPSNTGGATSMGAGTFQSHSTHTEVDSDDLKGPGIYCSTCHNTTKFPLFRSVADPNAELSLADTDVCDECHSQGGSYDGIDDSGIGAKRIWRTGAYVATDDSTLRSDKQKWCAGCHDDVPSSIQSIDAPNVIGDENGSYTYGIGWGYYKTGHGLASNMPYPYKGGLIEPPLLNGSAKPIECDSCHDFRTAHIDGLARTYDDGGSTSLDPSYYRQGYRLKQVLAGFGSGLSSKEPMLIPKPQNTGNSEGQFRLCANCHDSDPAFLDADDLTSTNLITTRAALDGTKNRHAYHLDQNSYDWSSDWSGGYTSRMTCVSCHNVHGSTRLAMVRDGKLVGAEPGQLIWYKNDSITVFSTSNPDPPIPEELPLSASDGTVWIGNSSGNLCSHCHGSGNTVGEDRIPFQDVSQAPALEWTGENNFLSDGANPDSGASGSNFEFRVKYSDANNDDPLVAGVMQVWVDEDDSGTYEPAEQYDMEEADLGDTYFIDGKLYTKTITLSLAGDNVISYRFYASDGALIASGPPTEDGSIVIFPGGAANNAPLLEWVADSCRPEGVKPRAGSAQGSFGETMFEFYVKYTDADTDCPPGVDDIQVWVDANDNGSYESGEKHNLSPAGGSGCATGMLYSYQTTLGLSGDNMLNYRFHASDGSDDATGEPTGDSQVTVYNGDTVVTVCDSGCSFTSIQAAVNGVTDDQTILVKPKTYNENLLLNGDDDRTILISECGKGETIINGSASNVVTVNSGNSGSVIDGFGITNGPRGMSVDGAATPTITNSSVYTNSDGVYLNNSSSITIRNCVISGNTSNGVYTNSSSATVENSLIDSNGGTDSGAGFYFNYGTHIISDSTINNNTTTASGGGIYFNGAGGTVTNTRITGNSTGGSGAGMYMGNGATPSFDKCTITGNSATSTNGGGGMYITGSGTTNVTMQNTIVAGNQAPKGGAAYLHSGTTSFINVTFADNQATAGSGGAFATCGLVNNTVRNSIFWNNTATGSGDNAYKECGSATFITVTDSDISTAAGYIDGGSISTDGSNITPAQDPMFVGSGDYHIKQADSPVVERGNATYAPPDDIDGDVRPQGSADDMGADEYVSGGSGSNTVPTLSWTGEPDYISDGVHPDSGNSGQSFAFRVDYTDADNDAPVLMQVWVDEDANGVYGATEKHDMAVDGGDGDYTNGERYALSLVLNATGGGTLQYRFYASDGSDDATGPPTADKTVGVMNNVPLLEWTGEANYITDGVDPESGPGGTDFTFRVKYSDADGTAPATIQVWIDTDDSGTYESGEKTDLTIVGIGDDYVGGEIFTETIMLAHVGDGTLNYRFYATDGVDSAIGSPTSDSDVSVSAPSGNNPPVLSWSTANCLANGVRPGTGAEDTDFEFMVTFTDADIGQCADIIQVWIDENDNGSFDTNEKYDLAESDPGDADCTDGKVYNSLVFLELAGDGILNYRFFGTDGREAADGTPPTSGDSLTVISAFKVKPVSAAGWYQTIQAAIDASGDPSTILVYPDIDNDFSAATYIEDALVTGGRNNRTILSACGPDLTIVEGTGAAVTFNNSSDNGQLEGFSLTGATTGVNLNTVDPVTIRNCKIYGNTNGIYANNGSSVTVENNLIYNNTGRGIYASPGSTSTHISSSEIYSNGNVLSGAAVYYNYGIHTITDSIIRDNSTTASAGGIYFNGTGAGTTVTNTIISDNTSTSSGGGLFINNGANVSFSKCTITSNRATAGTGGAMYVNGSSPDFENCIVAGNQATEGGALAANNQTSSFVNTTFAGNQATSGRGGAVYLNCATTTVRNSIFWNNTATGAGNTMYKSCGGGNGGTITDSDITTSAGSLDGDGGTTWVTSSNMDPAQDPLFTADYHIQIGSPVIDQANAAYAPPDDIDGDVRPEGAADDMGADEFVLGP